MSIKVRCPNSRCGKIIEIADHFADQRVSCPVCSQGFIAPTPKKKTKTKKPKKTQSSASAPAGYESDDSASQQEAPKPHVRYLDHQRAAFHRKPMSPAQMWVGIITLTALLGGIVYGVIYLLPLFIEGGAASPPLHAMEQLQKAVQQGDKDAFWRLLDAQDRNTAQSSGTELREYLLLHYAEKDISDRDMQTLWIILLRSEKFQFDKWKVRDIRQTGSVHEVLADDPFERTNAIEAVHTRSGWRVRLLSHCLERMRRELEVHRDI